MEPTPTPRPSEPQAAAPRPAPRPTPRAGRGRIPAVGLAAGRACSRPGCDTPPAATLVFSYGERIARLVELYDDRDPQSYDLCGPHADRTSPPRGWELADARPARAERQRPLDEDETVAVLAAALRGEAPRARVDVIEGERVDEVDDAPAAVDATLPALPAPSIETDETDDAAPAAADEEPVGEDPLREALEELQRIVADDEPEDHGILTEAPPAPIALHRPRGGGPDVGDDLTLW